MRARFGEAWDRLFAPAIAHRGLWSPKGPPENSLAAFEAAQGYDFKRRKPGVDDTAEKAFSYEHDEWLLKLAALACRR